MARKAILEVGVYYYIFPTYSQAKKVIWDSITNDGMPFLDYIPAPLIRSKNSQEMKIVLVNGSIIQLVGSDNVDCFDDQTEILTENGWKLFKDLSRDETVATLVEGYLEYHKPLKYVEYDYDGPMYSVSNSSIDFKVTTNHRFWVRSSKGKYKFKYINDPTIKNDSIPAKCKWDGLNQDIFIFPPMDSEWTCGKGRGVIKQYRKTMPMEDFVALLGIYLSEGSCYSDHNTYRITISQTKENIRNDIRSLLDRIDINYQEAPDRFNIEDKQLYTYFSQFGKQLDRFIPKDIKALNAKYLSILFDWLLKGDGYIGKDCIYYYSISKRLIDDIQEIIIKLGSSANISIKDQRPSEIRGRIVTPKNILYQIRVRTTNFKRLISSKKDYIKTEWYRGKVNCVSVPSGIIKVRRNGKEYWSGNSLVGTNPRGCVFSEFALQDPRAYQYIRPILVANGGWSLFISTPRGKSALWDLYQIAQKSKDWFVYKLTVEDTRHISLEDIRKEEEEGLMSADLIQQEYFTSFEMGVEGSYYAKYIDKLRLKGQIGKVNWDPSFKVNTAWDIGMRDSTSIIFFQICGTNIHIIDCYERSKEGLEHYVQVINSKPYQYGKHIGPHDLRVREFTSGIARVDKARQLGINFTIADNLSIEDGIEAVRTALPKMYIDEERCGVLIKALENYRQEYDQKKKVYKSQPLHDQFSHMCDAARYLAISLPKMRDGMTVEDIKKLRAQAYGDNTPYGNFGHPTQEEYDRNRSNQW